MYVVLQSGARVAARYEIIERLGEGRFGVVYRAKDVASSAEVALKVIAASADARALERFRREGIRTCELQHENTVRCFDAGTDPTLGVCYLALELLEGETLGALIEREAPLDPLRALALLEQLGASLAEAHALGIIHRDLKPDNIMVVPRHGEAWVKVIDFGLARAIGAEGEPRLTHSGAFVGSPAWMAPEQILGEAVDHRADLYALMVITYQLIGGQLPFSGRTAAEVLKKHCEEAAPSIRAVKPDLDAPPALEDVMLSGLSKAPADRPANVTAMVEGLRRALVTDDGKTVRLRATPLIAQLRVGRAPLAQHRDQTASAVKTRRSSGTSQRPTRGSELRVVLAGAAAGLLILGGLLWWLL